MCGGGGGIFKSASKAFKSVGKGISSAFKGITKGVSGILKSPIAAGLAGAAIGALTGGMGLPVSMGGMGMLGGAAVGGAIGTGVGMLGSSMSQPKLPQIDMNIPEAPVPAPNAIAPTGTGALVEVGAASDELRSASGKRGAGKRTSSSVAGLGAGGLQL